MTDRIRLLLVEDNPQDADLLLVSLQANAPEIEVEVAGTGSKCLELLEQKRHDVVLLDYRLPDMDGTDVLRLMHQRDFKVPVVLVTGVGDEGLVVSALRLGAYDYVPKSPGYHDSLPGILRCIVREFREKMVPAHGIAQCRRRILYVEHGQMDVELTLRHFATEAPHITLDVVGSCRDALRILKQVDTQGGAPPYDLLMADLRMPDMSALDLCVEARHEGIPVPVVIVTGGGDEETAIAALRVGAYDYIVKRAGYLHELPYAVENACIRFQLHRANEHLRAALEAANQSLEKKVRDRTAELQREVAERTRAEESLSEFAERLRVLSRRLLAVQEEERRRVSRELHDEVGQALTSVRVHLQSVGRQPDAGPVAPLLHECTDMIDGAIQRVRDLALQLRPSILDDLGLVPAIRWQTALLAERSGLSASIVAGPEVLGVPSEIETVCFRVAQEALTNIVRHAKAHQVRVELGVLGPELHLKICDDGTGFDLPKAQIRSRRGESFGLLGMEERVHLVGGSIEIASEIGRGTTILARLPIKT